MVAIARACQILGVARSTLLYYERIGIISPERNPENGYRNYTRDNIHALVLIRQLQKAGFSLKEADAITKGHLDSDLILSRYHALGKEIGELMTAVEVVKSLVIHAGGEGIEETASANPASWHAELEKTAGEAHGKWLERLGFNEKEQIYIRWVTRNLTNSGEYMEDFFWVFEQMKRQGPGSRASTSKAFGAIPDNHKISSILEVGCGKGQSSLVLSEISRASITAIDNHQPFLDHLEARASEKGGKARINVRNMSMLDMDFEGARFDLIWAEGSAYFMGVKKALSQWRSLISPSGYLFISDAVWLTDQPSPACAEYFKIEYPGMSNVRTRKKEARELGYKVVADFILPRQDWLDFYDDMEDCVNRAVKQKGMSRAYENMISEIKIARDHGEEFGYVCLLLSPTS